MFGLVATGAVSYVSGTSATVTSTFAPVADAYVSSAKPNTNYGSNPKLRVEASPVQRAYLRFDVQGVTGTVSRATLRVFATNRSSVGYEVRGTSDTSWSEAAITYGSAPQPFSSVTGTSGGFGSGVTTSVDVTSLVGGNGPVSFVLTTTDSSAISLSSREAGSNPPQLVIEAVDNTPPAPTLASPVNGSSTTDTTPSFSGVGGTAAGDAATVVVKVFAGATASGSPVRTLNAAVGAGGAYSVDAAPALEPGTYTAQAEQQDSGGNTGFSTASTFTVQDTVAPAVSLSSPAHGSTTADTTPSFGGIGGTAAGDAATVMVRVYAGPAASGTALQTLTATVGAGGAYSVDASAALAQGQYTAQARQTDAAGNTGLSSANTFTVSLDPTPPVITLGAPADGSTTTDTTPTFSGTAGTAPGDSSVVAVKIYAGTGTSGPPVQTQTTTAAAGGSYSVDASPPLATGIYTARAEQQDSGGNTGFSSSNTFTISDPVFVGAGDIADCGDGTVNTAAIINGMPQATVYTVGDNSYPNGTPSDYASCYQPTWGAFKARTRPTIGDHDYGDGSNPTAAGYFGFFQQQLAPFGAAALDSKRGWYSYDLGAWHIVHLNAQCYDYAQGCIPSEQEAWLRADLAAHSNVCGLVIWHEPRWSSGSVHGNTPTMQAFWAAAYELGADVVLSGSDHIYERFAPMNSEGLLDTQQGVRQFTVGTGGASHYAIGTIKPNSQVRNVDAFGVLKLTLHPTSYDWQFVPEAGRTFTDSGTQACHGPPPPPPEEVPDVRGVSSNSGNAIQSISIDTPAGTVEGDLLVALVSHQSGSNRTMTAPAGWTAIPNTDVFEGTNAHIHGWYKLAGASEPPSHTFVLSGTDGRDTAGAIIAVSGVNQANPIDASGGQNNGSTGSTSVPAPSITTTVPNTLLIYAGSGSSLATYTAPAGMTEQFDRTTTGTFKVSIEGATQPWTNVGPTGTRTALASTSVRTVAVMIAVRPA